MWAAPPEEAPKYALWKTNLEGFQERSQKRAEDAQRREADCKRLEQMRQAARERKELEDKRRLEVEERAERRRKEASEYSAWRDNVVLARRAEERTRAVEHCEWRDRVSKLRVGQSQRIHAHSSTLPCAHATPRKDHYASACAVDLFQAPLRGGSSEIDVSCSERADIRFDEEDAWAAAVTKNRAALHAEREEQRLKAEWRKREEQWMQGQKKLVEAKAGAQGLPRLS